MAELPRVPRRNALTQEPGSSVSGADIATPYRILADTMGEIGQRVETAFLPQAEGRGARSVTRGPDGQLTVQQRPEWSRTDQAFNRGARVAFLAELGPEVTKNLAEIRRQHEGNLDQMQQAFAAYGDQLIANQTPELAAPVRALVANEIERYSRGAETDFYNNQTRRHLAAIRGAIDLKSEEMAALARNGGIDSEDYRHLQAEYYDLWREAIADPRFQLTREEVEAEVLRTENNHAEVAARVSESIDRDGREEVEKEGTFLDSQNLLTPDWLEAHRDDLSPPAYRRFARSLGDLVAGGPQARTDPQEFVRLLDLAESDSIESRARAAEEAREAYLEERISKTDFNRLMTRAAGGGDQRFRKAGIAEVRRFVGGALRPKEGDGDGPNGRFLDQMLRFDEWLEANPEATARDVQTYGETFVKMERALAALQSTSPLPEFPGVLKPEDLRPRDIERGRALLRRAIEQGLIDTDSAGEQAELLEEWEKMIGAEDARAR